MDYLWFSLFMKKFFMEKASGLVSVVDGSLHVNLLGALVVYIVMAVAVAVFVLPRATTLTEALGYGALLGFLMYACYDFTNYATLNNYPLSLAIVDIAWGTLLMGAGSLLLFWIHKIWT